MIDTHIHGDARTGEDFNAMYLSGIDVAVTCAYYPYKIDNDTILLNHLMRILNYDTKRAEEYGLDLKVALGIHPTNTSVDGDIIYENLYRWIENRDIIAIGEIGLEDLTEKEYEIFKKQLDIGQETKTNVIIHTPRKNKGKVLDEILNILPQHISPEYVVIDHINQNVVEKVIDTDYTLGLTVQPQKMDKFEAIRILEEYGFDNFLLNSDISNKASDPLSVPKTVRELTRQGFNKKDIDKVAFKNAEKFFNL
ncbi:TatD family hydrolase [uncultured Methanobrevibacter sp.]|uniref:TatD family hydrolase n=1 Tax=uncultured Methanobrevibacter sp. TaxID=253161 RepID=UPI0025E7D39B|nr:TatD family hydrolase [uncultured Methanobrevibacter sp.]